ncbi:DNA-3-methyladenine glycosylase family protein [Butyrivibrio sp. AE3006]|uniref:DNA-3-methyladenine glycosylase family protein n=1 Tax=Butyrivibrio sp. AE3006 TaxID=1280673 RepID=UPI0004005720|nr:DNA glycosylase [Butyrivibrio sp. AE3006]
MKNIIQIEDDFDLEKIAESGQCFRWQRLDEYCDEKQATGTPERKKYRIPYRDSCLIISEAGDKNYEIDCSEEEFREIWWDYFDLGTNYEKVRKRIRKKDDPFLYEAAKSCMGIRILKQDPWETLISFIISQNRNIPAIKRSIEILCSITGDTKKDSEGREYYAFPGAEAIMAMSSEELSECKLGYRDEYVRLAAENIKSGVLNLEELSAMNADDAIEGLMAQKGIGLKVASCVALFGLHQLDAFPVDVWIKKVLANEYPNGYPKEKYAPYSGIYQQYMFAYYRAKY